MKDTKQHTLERRAYGVAEVAAALGVSAGFVRLEIARGRFEVIRAGRRVLISKVSFEAYLSERSTCDA